MSRTRLILILAAVFLLVVGGTVVAVRSLTARDDGNPDGQAYAYTTKQALVVMRGSRMVTRVARTFDPTDPQHNKYAWTQTGDYIALPTDDFFIENGDPSKEKIISINTHTGAQQHLACAYCYDVVAIGGNSVLASVSRAPDTPGIDYFRFEIDQNKQGSPFELFPDSTTSMGSLPLLGATNNFVFTRENSSAGDGIWQNIDAVAVSSRKDDYLGRFESNDYMPVAIRGQDGTSGEQIALGLRMDPGMCRARFPIIIVDLKGNVITTDTSAAAAPTSTARPSNGIDVQDLWWWPDGHLRATLASWSCDTTKHDEDSKKVIANTPSLWRLEGNKWVKEDSDPVTIVRPLDANAQVLFSRPECIGPTDLFRKDFHCNEGVLRVKAKGSATVISPDALDVSVRSN